MKKFAVIIMTVMMLLLLLSTQLTVSAQGVTAYYNGTGLYRDANCTSMISIDGGDTAARAYRATITDIQFVGEVTKIGWGALNFCSNLEYVTLPKSVTSIDGYAFQSCTNLKGITIPSSITSISSDAFSDCNFDTKDGITLLYTSTGSADNLGQFKGFVQKVVFDDNVTTIRDHAFESCGGLRIIKLPDRITSIGEYAFSNSGLVAIGISDQVESISSNAFCGCTFMEEFAVYGDNKYFTTEDGILFDKAETMLIQYPAAYRSIRIPDSVTRINDYAFNYSHIQEIVIPDSVTSIGADAFLNCQDLEKVTISNTVTNIPDNAFMRCLSLKEIVIPDSVTSIGANAFYECERLKDVAISHNVTSIGENAFTCCSSLKKITIPDKVATIADGAFQKCYGLNRAYFYGNAPTFGKDLFTESSDSFKIIYPYNKAASWTKVLGDKYPSAPGFSVAFNSQGGSQIADTMVAQGDKVDKPNDPSKDHCIFEGWYKDVACTEEWKFDFDTVTGDTKLYAKWLSYQIAPIDNQALAHLSEGYASGTQESKKITICNTGNQDLQKFMIDLTGPNAEDFIITKSGITTLKAGQNTNLGIEVQDGLAAGLYTATVTIKADHISPVTFTVTQAVGSAPIPGEPTNVIAVAGNGQATVSFFKPSDDGGTPITKYIVTSDPGGITAEGISSPVIVNGLTNGTTYTFKVKAVNNVGIGKESAASSGVIPQNKGGGNSGKGKNSSAPTQSAPVNSKPHL